MHLEKNSSNIIFRLCQFRNIVIVRKIIHNAILGFDALNTSIHKLTNLKYFQM